MRPRRYRLLVAVIVMTAVCGIPPMVGILGVRAIGSQADTVIGDWGGGIVPIGLLLFVAGVLMFAPVEEERGHRPAATASGARDSH